MSSDFADAVAGAIAAIEGARTRLGSPRSDERPEIHPWTRRAIYWRDGNRCGWCYRGFDDAGMLVLDHIQPWADGGSDRSDNLRTLCVPCNDDRSNFATDAYARVMPVGMCDHCHTRPRWDADNNLTVLELDPESTFRQPIFCGRCGHVDVSTDPRRVR